MAASILLLNTHILSLIVKYFVFHNFKLRNPDMKWLNFIYVPSYEKYFKKIKTINFIHRSRRDCFTENIIKSRILHIDYFLHSLFLQYYFMLRGVYSTIFHHKACVINWNTTEQMKTLKKKNSLFEILNIREIRNCAIRKNFR